MTLLLLFTILYGNIFLMMSLHEVHIYIMSVSINRMLISQLKRFLCVKFMLPPQFNVFFLILHLFLISML